MPERSARERGRQDNGQDRHLVAVGVGEMCERPHGPPGVLDRGGRLTTGEGDPGGPYESVAGGYHTFRGRGAGRCGVTTQPTAGGSRPSRSEEGQVGAQWR